MSLEPSYTNQFEKDLKLCKKRNKKIDKLKTILSMLIDEIPISVKNKDHKLLENYQGRRECHIEPDWLLIYKIENKNIVFERTGSHSDLFD